MRSSLRKLSRNKLHNYDDNGYYFITICVDEEVHYFGEVGLNNQMYLSEMGIIAHKLWYEIPNHIDDITVDEFIVMPDHIHGIIIINNTIVNTEARRQNQILPVAIGSYKSSVSREIHKFDYFGWQRSYYDKIIRNKTEYLNIKNYIKSNIKRYNEKM